MGAKTKNYSYLAPDFALRAVAKRYNGEVTEWFKERAWKVRIPQKGIAGSNPALSATNDNLKLKEINKLNTKQ